jgi:type I restriction enzyme R subunit
MSKQFHEIFESFSSIMELLRNDNFQDLLVSYERAKKVFLVAYEIQDSVSSQILFDAQGKLGLKPEDYLIAFAEFVKQKEDEIEAIAIILNKPKEWNTKALNDLRQTLRDNDYDEQSLQKAHRIVYHKEAVDIISMVKHAAKETEPLLSPEERVEQAVLKVTAGKQLNDEQQKWIEYIKEHLKQNMTIDENDLNEVPVFADRGGLSKFKRVFESEYQNLINELNLAIAA